MANTTHRRTGLFRLQVLAFRVPDGGRKAADARMAAAQRLSAHFCKHEAEEVNS